MKARATLLLVLVLSLALVPVLASVPVHAQSQYNERLDVYTTGQNAFWSITREQARQRLCPRSRPSSRHRGSRAYRLVAMSTQSAVSDFQIFGVDGYNLLGLPSTPSEGLFLTVNATGELRAVRRRVGARDRVRDGVHPGFVLLGVFHLLRPGRLCQRRSADTLQARPDIPRRVRCRFASESTLDRASRCRSSSSPGPTTAPASATKSPWGPTLRASYLPRTR